MFSRFTLSLCALLVLLAPAARAGDRAEARAWLIGQDVERDCLSMRQLPASQRAQLDLWVEGQGRRADRQRAMRALTRCDGSDHTFRRIANVLTQREPLDLRAEAARLLAEGWGDRATQVLDETLSRPIPIELGITVATALGEIASPNSVSALRKHQANLHERPVEDAIRIALRRASSDQPHNQ